MAYTVHFFPMNQKISLEEPENLLKICSKIPILLDGSCAGQGICGRCKVQILKGDTGELTEVEKEYLKEEEVAQGYRLACQMEVTGDLTVMVPDLHGSSNRKKAMNQFPEGFVIHPAVEHHTKEHCYGLAVDIGTTTVVAILWDLKIGKMVDVEATTNPQSIYGADVISRIQYCMEGERIGEDHLLIMQQAVIGCINDMIQKMTERNELDPSWIYDMTAVGNTTMCHLFLGKNPASLARYPFTPQYTGGQVFMANDLGIEINEDAQGYVLPGIAGHVGSDITAVMLATDLIHQKGNHVAIDIGTNGEILVARDGNVLACSTAAGPAFEGASIQCGMRAAKGAIEKVEIDDAIYVKTIDQARPVGICGSGLVDVTAELLTSGLVASNGNLLTKDQALEKAIGQNLADHLYGTGRNRGITLVSMDDSEDIVLTQKDIREVQLAKGAVLGGMKTLMHKIGMEEEQIDLIYIAGAFGSYIDKTKAIKMGLLPRVNENKVKSIGNAAGVGSSMALLSVEKRMEAEAMVKEVTHVELSKDMEFQELYIKSMNF